MFPELELKEGWATVALLLIILFCVAWSIQTANWTEGLAILQAIVLVGGLIGIVLAKSHIPGITAHLLSLLAGFTWTAFLASRVLAGATGLPIEAAVAELDRLIVAWFSVLLSGGESAGNYVFLVLLGLLLWLVAYFSAWAIFRHATRTTLLLPITAVRSLLPATVRTTAAAAARAIRWY